MQENDKNFTVTSFYKFRSLDKAKLESVKTKLAQRANELDLKGLLLLGAEGVNAGLSGKTSQLAEFKQYLINLLDLGEIFFKDHQTEKQPYRRMKVKIREEIVTLGRPDLKPEKDWQQHLTPEEWDKLLEHEDVVVIDTRNDYEVALGKFEGAIDLKIKDFQEFPEAIKKGDISKDKKILIYCTGGIRCEKAILEMHEQGYQDVHQLYGGIINYLDKVPEGKWKGECFVFDHRVAVDSKLQPSQKYSLCPHCGDPADLDIECVQCGRADKVCKECWEIDESKKTCSKNCSHHYRLGHTTRRVHLDGLKKRGRI